MRSIQNSDYLARTGQMQAMPDRMNRAAVVRPNNRARSLGPPNTLSQRLLQQKFGINPGNDMRRINAGGGMNTGAGSPTIRGWQNYTGKTMGEVGQYSRIPGFGRSFRG